MKQNDIPDRLWLIVQDGTPLPSWYRFSRGDELFETEQEYEFVRAENEQQRITQLENALREFCDYYSGAREAQLGNGQARTSLYKFRAALTGTSEQEK